MSAHRTESTAHPHFLARLELHPISAFLESLLYRKQNKNTQDAGLRPASCVMGSENNGGEALRKSEAMEKAFPRLFVYYPKFNDLVKIGCKNPFFLYTAEASREVWYGPKLPAKPLTKG